MPLPKYLLQVFSHTTDTDNLLIRADHRNGKEVIMTTLRALIGAYSALAFLGFTIFAPLMWIAILIAVSTATP